jgi:hypothetical protein
MSRFVKSILGRDRINPKFTTSTGSPAALFGGGGDVHLNTTNGKIFKKDNIKGWVEVYDLVTASEAGSFDSLTSATGLTITAAGTVTEPAIKIGNGEGGFYQISGTQLGVSISNALATVFSPQGVLTDGLFARVELVTAGTNCTAVSNGDGRNFTTVVTITAAVLPNITGPADQAVGALIASFPAGAHIHTATRMSMAISLDGINSINASIETGLGSVIATGAVSVLGGTPTFEDYIDGSGNFPAGAAGEVLVTGPVVATAGALTGISMNETGDVKDIHYNIAATWSGSSTTCTITGTVVFNWTLMS